MLIGALPHGWETSENIDEYPSTPAVVKIIDENYNTYLGTVSCVQQTRIRSDYTTIGRSTLAISSLVQSTQNEHESSSSVSSKCGICFPFIPFLR